MIIWTAVTAAVMFALVVGSPSRRLRASLLRRPRGPGDLHRGLL